MRKNIDNVNQSGKAPDDDVLELVHGVMHQYRSRQFQVLRDGPHAVTHMESKVLGFFGRHAGGTLSDLARHSGRDKAQLTRLVTGLRERGLLAGEADEADRRSVRLQLTADGKSIQRSLQEQARRQATRALAGFNAEERAQLQALLLRVKANLDVAG